MPRILSAASASQRLQQGRNQQTGHEQDEEDGSSSSSSSSSETSRLLPTLTPPAAVATDRAEAGPPAAGLPGSSAAVGAMARGVRVAGSWGAAAAPARAQEEGEQEQLQCRICFETHSEPDDPLISPCKCAGSSQHIHRQCLRKWRESALQNPRSLAYYRCEVCHFEYKFMRSDLAAFISNPYSVAVLFTVLLFVCTVLLGFVPLVQTGLSMAGAGSSLQDPTTWSWLLLHVLNGLLLVGWIGGLVLLTAACVGRNTARNCYCPGCYLFGDCSGLLAGGEACAPVLLLLLVLAAVLGLLAVLPYAYAALYSAVRQGSEATVHMVENIGLDRTGGKKEQEREVPV